MLTTSPNIYRFTILFPVYDLGRHKMWGSYATCIEQNHKSVLYNKAIVTKMHNGIKAIYHHNKNRHNKLFYDV